MNYISLLLFLLIPTAGFTQEIAVPSNYNNSSTHTINQRVTSISEAALHLYNYKYKIEYKTDYYGTPTGQIKNLYGSNYDNPHGKTLVEKRITYDPAYVNLKKLNSNDIDTHKDQNGDIIFTKGVCTDVIVRSLRIAHGYDLKTEVNKDMRAHFSSYPKIWGLKGPDTNIDHRRVPNLETFFKRSPKFTTVPLSKSENGITFSNILPGDIVTYRLGGRIAHIGIVSNEKTIDGLNYKVIHHNTGEISHDDFLIPSQMKQVFRYKK